MKRILLLSIIIAFATGLYCFKQLQVVEENSNAKRIAILLPLSHPALDEIKDGFIKTLSEKMEINYDVYNGNGDRLLMRTQAQKAFDNNYDLVLAISTPIALICNSVSTQRNNNTPVICAGVSENPVEIGLVKSIATSENNFVVVSDHYDFQKQLNALLKLYPTNRIILPFYPSPGLQKQVDELKILCKKMNIELSEVKVYSVNELFAKVDAMLNNDKEVIMVLKDNEIVSGIEALVNLAARKNKILYASDLNSFDKGANLAFGVSEFAVGAQAAKIAFDILQNQKLPSEISSVFADNFELKVKGK
ncbi:MAG: ABC transporter substrate-binding protein [Candidatus Babeliales bacterium]|nr:ABC transporter substrate-binding protein [Candidatus Babeliales bacterium]